MSYISNWYRFGTNSSICLIIKKEKMTLRNFDKIFDSYLDWDMSGYGSDTTHELKTMCC